MSGGAKAEAGGPHGGVVPCEPQIKVESFSGVMLDQHFSCQITHLEGSYFIWVGIDAENPAFVNLSAAVNTRFDKRPVVTTLIGGGLDEGGDMAARLTKKSGSMVFMSCNLEGIDDVHMLAAYIERQIAERIVPNK